MDWLHIVLIVVIMLIIVCAVAHNANMQRDLAECKAANEQCIDMLNDKRTTAQAYLNACRLIAIHRDGRVNVWTFARHDKNFMVETIGCYSDDVDAWRKAAGLDNDDASKVQP